jgi:hypothetical protein
MRSTASYEADPSGAPGPSGAIAIREQEPGTCWPGAGAAIMSSIAHTYQLILPMFFGRTDEESLMRESPGPPKRSVARSWYTAWAARH